MRIIFAGRYSRFNKKLVSELAQDHDIICCLFLESDFFTGRYQYTRLRKRIRKYGIFKAIDELAFHAFDRLFLRSPESKFIKSRPDYFVDSVKLNCPCYHVKNVHDAQWIELITQQAPDIIFSLCCSVIFKSKLYDIPKWGTFVLHEGLTPEYKGLHTTLWALLKKKYQYIGYTVLKVNRDIDGGDILVQGRYQLNTGENCRTWSWIGHNALIEGLDEIKKSLRDLELNKGFIPLDIKNRSTAVYSWIGLSTFLRLYKRS